MLLRCSNRCGGTLFRALFAEVDLGAEGEYEGHRILQSSYVCLNCGSPALDLSEVPGAIRAEEEEDESPAAVEILCPVCESRVMVGPDRECPNCGAFLEEIEVEG
jgi:DNA-directed RNA polymerase subunit RPC12/RpoP